MAQYLFLLYGDGSPFRAMSPEDMQKAIQRYRAWSDSLRANGHYKAGNKLQDGTGRVLQKQGGDLVLTDGPYTESKEVVGGYYLVEADSYDKAVELARGCPHADFGTIEVRQIDQM